MALKNKIAYGSSRHETLRNCARQYWFQYYGSWNGWGRGTSPDQLQRRRIYVAKHANTVYSWAGQLVHSFAESELKWAKDCVRQRQSYQLPTMAELRPKVEQRVLEGMEEVRSGEYRERPKERLQLIEHNRGLFINLPLVLDRALNGIELLIGPDEVWEPMPESGKRLNLFRYMAEKRAHLLHMF